MSRFRELLDHPGVVEQVTLRSTFGFMAFHGGSLEAGTDGVALAAAEASGASLYTVCQPDGFRWHLPSSEFDPAVSDHLAAFVDHVDVAVAIHGYGRDGLWTTLLLGGSNRALAGVLAASLRTHLPMYEAVDDLEVVPVALRGVHPGNPVNRPRLGGVQLELPPRVRGMGPFWAEHPDRPVPHTVALIAALAEVAAAWPATS